MFSICCIASLSECGPSNCIFSTFLSLSVCLYRSLLQRPFEICVCMKYVSNCLSHPLVLAPSLTCHLPYSSFSHHTQVYHKGLIDDFRIWNVSLTQSQIKQRMFSSLQDARDQPNLIGYWTFDDSANRETARDYSSGGHNLQFGGCAPCTDRWTSSTLWQPSLVFDCVPSCKWGSDMCVNYVGQTPTFGGMHCYVGDENAR